MSRLDWLHWLPSRSLLEPQAELLYRAKKAREARESSVLFSVLAASLMLLFNLANMVSGVPPLAPENLLRFACVALLVLPFVIGRRLSDQGFERLWFYISLALVLLVIEVFFQVGSRVGRLNEGGPLIVVIVLGSLPFYRLEQKAILWGVLLLGICSISVLSDVLLGWALFYCAVAVGLIGFWQYRIDLLQRLYFRYELAERAKAETDKLTGALNRHSFEQRLSDLMAQLQPGQTLSVGMLDIDYFKRYNDYYGHLKGDACLVAIARALEKLPLDLLVRFGGEEFIVVVVAEGSVPDYLLHLQDSISDLQIAHANSPLGHVTTSVGLCIYHHVADVALPARNELLAAADAALYRAKEEGRNRLCSTTL